MSRRHRHYRKHKTGFIAPEAVLAAPTIQSTTVGLFDGNLSIVRADLTKTAVIATILLAALILMSVTNAKLHWTLAFGSQLYSLLHIR